MNSSIASFLTLSDGFGIFSIFLVLNYTFMYNGLVLAVIIGVLSALFVKYLFDFVFPKPLTGDEGEDINE